MIRILPLSIILLFLTTSFSQNIQKEIHVSFTNSKISIDGILNETGWEKALPSSDFFEYFPSDSISAQQQSEIKMLFDSKLAKNTDTKYKVS